MADTTVVVEGKIKFRDGKKWKPRWCVMKKPSPVADRLQVLLYKDVREAIRDGGKPKTNFQLEGFYGIESFTYDKEVNVMALVCHKQITLLAFESRDTLIQFEVKIRKSLGQEHQFPVKMAKVPNNSRVPLDLVRMHIHGQKFCLTAYIPPKILQSWQICDLRRFGSVEGKFCFEGGSKCGRGMGIHVALSEQAQEISEIVQLASQGKLHSCSANINKRKTGNNSNNPCAKSDSNNLQYSTLVVSVNDLNDRLDAISVDSHESSDTHSIRSEETLRSSPASTILRPRSGKDYQVIERRRTTSGSCASSPQTPYSPSTATVFSFESTFSSTSAHFEEPNSYMNIDMTPSAKGSVSSSRHVSDHEVSPERTFREKLISERDKRSAEREKLSSERDRVFGERTRLKSEKHKHHGDSALSHVGHKSEKDEANVAWERVSPEKDKHSVDSMEDSLETDGVNCEDIDRTRSERVSCERETATGAASDLSHAVSAGTSPPLSPLVPTSPIPPEQIYPQLNYAEIDLSTACSTSPPPPPVEPTPKRRPKKVVPETPIAYATIDMMATNAVKQAGIEHAQSREDSLRRSVSVYHRKNTAASGFRDRKFSMRERKMSTDSLD